MLRASQQEGVRPVVGSLQLMVVRLWRGVAVVGERRVVLRRKKK